VELGRKDPVCMVAVRFAAGYRNPGKWVSIPLQRKISGVRLAMLTEKFLMPLDKFKFPQ
jgi:hypothetical protein